MPPSRRPLIGTSDILRKNVYEGPRKNQKALRTSKIHGERNNQRSDGHENQDNGHFASEHEKGTATT